MTTPPIPQTRLMDEAMTVGQVAEELGVTVRTLHHYDELGLLTPTGRTAAGYRLYSHTDLERLSMIVLYRRLGFGLEQVGELQGSDGRERVEHLRRQRDEVMARLAEMSGLVDAIDHALEAEMNERPTTTEDLKAILGDGYSEERQAEAEERWGETDAWRQSQQRTSGFTKADWQRVKDETEAVESAAAAALREGVDATSPEGLAIARRHRESIETFYDCSPQMHVSLAQMYLADARFTAHYDDREPGLARWLHDAILALATARP